MSSTQKVKVAFNGTAEQEKALRSMIKEHKGQAGALMPILQKAQEIYGYLPIEVQWGEFTAYTNDQYIGDYRYPGDGEEYLLFLTTVKG